jgi:hypothetical protein
LQLAISQKAGKEGDSVNPVLQNQSILQHKSDARLPPPGASSHYLSPSAEA